MKWRRESKERNVVQEQTHLRENKREEVNLYNVNSRVEKMKKKDPEKTGDEGRELNGWGK